MSLNFDLQATEKLQVIKNVLKKFCYKTVMKICQGHYYKYYVYLLMLLTCIKDYINVSLFLYL